MSNHSGSDWFPVLSSADGEVQGDGSKITRILIAAVYSVVCALGLVGNILVLYLLHSKYRKKRSPVNFFVINLAVTDFQFVLTLPFWAVETALDFSWPFGKVMCKIISSVTTMTMYCSVFFLTAMSVHRYSSVTCSLKMKSRGSSKWLTKLVSLVIWTFSLILTLPHVVFSTTVVISEEELCLVKFPDLQHIDPQVLLGVYQTQKVLFGFLIPLLIITISYMLLVRFVGNVNTCNKNPKRASQVTKSVTIVVLSFFVCWLPNQSITAWGIFIKFNVVPFSEAYYIAQAYVFPLTVCLAHTNSCLNPVLYCLIRQEFRIALKHLLFRVTPSFRRLGPVLSNIAPQKKDRSRVSIQMNNKTHLESLGRG
ncbi:relaxin-3 receptor 1-like [Protopterus annectens]|uniref:relaxin-3 receptor 1-like n=1 Tax=Protopterus annectens TaxID=7888 RepID=UPI001CFB154E|nr:relaxin-3 receptor 1-like [Protopterus annectens]